MASCIIYKRSQRIMQRILQQNSRKIHVPTYSGKGTNGDNLERNSVTVKVPATTANMGPGFDTIGMALDVWNDLTVERADEFSMTVEGEGANDIPCDDTNLICKGLEAAFFSSGKKVPPLKYTCKNRIPFCRGMGSSSAGIVSGVLAGLVLSGHKLPVWGFEEFLQIAADLEGHADNVAPAIYGGCQIGARSGALGRDRWISSRVAVHHGIQCILFIPDFVAETKKVRGLLPDKWSKEEVVHNLQRMAILVNGLSTGNPSEILIGTEDALHQPYRAPVFKHMMPIIKAANKAGAHGAYLSGAGPTIMALTSGGAGDVFAQRDHERSENTVAAAMIREAERTGHEGRVFITQPTQSGAFIVEAEPAFSSSSLMKFQPGGWV